MRNSRSLIITSMMALLSACAPQHFEPVNLGDGVNVIGKTSEEISSNFFKMTSGESSFQQEILDENQTSVSFQVRLPNGTYKNDLNVSELQITENGIPVPNFQLTSNSDTIVQTVDIVFAVDVTGSMTPSIESAKTRLINFINATRAAGYHTRMCLITFGDYTVQNCNKFYDNDPKDPATQTQVAELISEITKLKALSGAEDPGGNDFPENPMRALIDAANAPWATDSQRFLILMTDDSFLYSPGNQGAIGDLAPKYTDVQAALQASQMKVFLAAPSLAGYDKNFSGQPGIVQASGGQFFLYSDLINGKITFDTILNQIISQIRTTYLVNYTVDEVPGLDPSMPLNKRHLEVTLKNGLTGSVVAVSVQSNLPNGGANYKKKWKLTDKKIKDGSVRVKINGIEIPVGFSIEAGQLIFALPPLPGVKIEVFFDYEALKDALQLVPIILNKNEDLGALSVLLNGEKAKAGDILFSKALDGSWSVSLSDNVTSEEDLFNIRKNGGLTIKVLRAGDLQ